MKRGCIRYEIHDELQLYEWCGTQWRSPYKPWDLLSVYKQEAGKGGIPVSNVSATDVRDAYSQLAMKRKCDNHIWDVHLSE